MTNATSARVGVGYNKGRGILNLSSQAQIDANLMSGVIKVNQWTSNQQGRPVTQGLNLKGDTNLSLNSSNAMINSGVIHPSNNGAIYQSEADFAIDNFTEG